MQRDVPTMRRAAVLEQVDALPGAEHGPAIGDRDRQAGRGQRRTKMGGHVVGAFVVMLVPIAFWRDAGEVALDVAARSGGGILLDQQ